MSHSTRHTRRSATSSMAAEIVGFSREMSGHLVNLLGQMQNQNEAMRTDAKQREKVLDQMKTQADEIAQKREQVLLKIKTDADEAARKREQFFMEHELKRQKMIVEAYTALQQEKLKLDTNREIANLEAVERRKL